MRHLAATEVNETTPDCPRINHKQAKHTMSNNTKQDIRVAKIDFTHPDQKKLVDNTVHDLYSMGAIFIIAIYDKNNDELSRKVCHPFTRDNSNTRYTNFTAWYAKKINSVASWRILVVNPTHRILNYLDRVKLTTEILHGDHNNIIDANL